MESPYTYIGKRTPLLDGQLKVTGQIRYVPDLTLPNMLHARPVMSLYAHAKIKGINKEAALKIPGVRAVITAEDLPCVTPSSRNRLMLARDRVIFMGQFVALVLAETEAAASDGARAVWGDYEPLQVAITVEEAMAEGPRWSGRMGFPREPVMMAHMARPSARNPKKKPNTIPTLPEPAVLSAAMWTKPLRKPISSLSVRFLRQWCIKARSKRRG